MLDWFTTIPGILIICGVILLIIAIILFIVGAKKSKKEGTTTTDAMNKPVEDVPAMEPVAEVTPVAPVTVEATNPSVDINTVSTEETIQITEPEQEVVTIEEPVVQETVVEAPVMDMPSVSEIPVVEEVNSTIYGGEVPTVDFSVSEEKPVTIYGGNDPLEATQTLPKVEEHHEPYGGAYPEARIVEPSESIEMPTPVEEVVSAMPTVEPVFDIASEEPEVQFVPAVEVAEVVAEPTPVTIPVEEEVKPTVEEL